MPVSQSVPCLDGETLLAFVTGVLGEAEIARVEAHLANCVSCLDLVADAAHGIEAQTEEIAPGIAIDLARKESEADERVDGASFGGSPLLHSSPSLPVHGDVLADKYRVEAFLGRGGMGEVFAATHVELGHRVAIKILRSADPTAGTRFLREAQTCALFASEHIVRVFDLGHLPGGAPYIVMECLAGEDLAHVVARGPVPVREAASYLVQACMALAESHAAGIVHRDLKPANLFLATRKAAAPLLKVLDFGVSKLMQEGSSDLALTTTGTVLGSPLYMSPEQIRAHKDVDARADIWALGVILYELLTGRRPFDGPTISALSVAIVNETPPRPSTLRADIPPGLEKALLQCLEKNRSARFASVQTLLEAILPFAAPARATEGTRASNSSKSSPTLVLSPGKTGEPSPGRWRRWIAAAALLACAGAASLGLRAQNRHGHPASLRRSVAVVGFRGLGTRPDDQWLSTAFSEMLGTELAVGEVLRVVPGELVAQMKTDLQLPETDRFGAETLARIRRHLQVEWVVDGSYVVEPGQGGRRLRLDVVLQDAISGDTLVTLSEVARDSELLDLVAHVGARLRGSLGVRPGAGPADAPRDGAPSDLEAARLYAQALVHQRAYDEVGARDLFEQVVAREPGFALAHSALADIYLGLGLDARARSEAQRATETAHGLGREERLLLEARYQTSAGHWDRAIELYRSLFDFFPDELTYGLALARVQTLAGRSAEALKTTDGLHRLAAPLADDPRIDLEEARAFAKQGDWHHRLAADERVIAKGRTIGARLLVAHAECGAAEAQFYLGQVNEARTAYAEAQRIYEALGEKNGAVVAETGLAVLLQEQGDFEGALRVFERAVEFYRRVGNEYGVADKLNLTAQVYQAQGDYDRARQVYAESREHFANIGEREGVANLTSNDADILANLGELDAAEKSYRQALALFNEVGMHTHAAASLGDIGATLWPRGRFAEAEALVSECLAKLRQIDDREKLMIYLTDSGDRLRERADLEGAAAAYREALQIGEERKVRGEDLISLRIRLARLELDAGRAEPAATAARALLVELQDHGAADEIAPALALLMRASIQRRELGELGELARRAAELAGKIPKLALRLETEIAVAEARAASGDCAVGRALDEVRANAEKHELLGVALQAELGRAEVELDCGQRQQGLARLRAASSRAAASGFVRLAGRAAAVDRSAPTGGR